MYSRTFMFALLHTHTHTNTQTHKSTHTHTDTQTHTHTLYTQSSHVWFVFDQNPSKAVQVFPRLPPPLALAFSIRVCVLGPLQDPQAL